MVPRPGPIESNLSRGPLFSYQWQVLPSCYRFWHGTHEVGTYTLVRSTRPSLLFSVGSCSRWRVQAERRVSELAAVACAAAATRIAGQLRASKQRGLIPVRCRFFQTCSYACSFLFLFPLLLALM